MENPDTTQNNVADGQPTIGSESIVRDVSSRVSSLPSTLFALPSASSSAVATAGSSIGRILPLSYPVNYYPSVSAALSLGHITTVSQTNPNPTNRVVMPSSPPTNPGAVPQVMVHQREYYVYSDEHINEFDTMKRRLDASDAEFMRLRERIGMLDFENERLKVEKEGLLQKLNYFDRESGEYHRIRGDMATILREREEVMAQVAKLEDRWADEVQQLRKENIALKRELNVLQYRNVREADARTKILRAEEEMILLDKELLRVTALLKERDQEILKLKQASPKSPERHTRCEGERNRLEELLKIERTERLHCEELISALREQVAFFTEEIAGLGGSQSRSPPRSASPKTLPHMRPMLGVEIKMLDDGIGGKDNVVVVHAVTTGGPAEQAGVRTEDILQLYNGQILDSKGKFQQLLEASTIGSQVILDVWRGGKVLKIPVTVGATASKQKKYKAKSKTALAGDNNEEANV